MGRNKSAKKDRGYVTAAEWATEGGGAKAKGGGTDAHPIWRTIAEALPGRPVDWNFAAWVLFDGTGTPVGRWGFSLQDIGNASFLSQLEAALARLSQQ